MALCCCRTGLRFRAQPAEAGMGARLAWAGAHRWSCIRTLHRAIALCTKPILVGLDIRRSSGEPSRPPLIDHEWHGRLADELGRSLGREVEIRGARQLPGGVSNLVFEVDAIVGGEATRLCLRADGYGSQHPGILTSARALAGGRAADRGGCGTDGRDRCAVGRADRGGRSRPHERSRAPRAAGNCHREDAARIAAAADASW